LYVFFFGIRLKVSVVFVVELFVVEKIVIVVVVVVDFESLFLGRLVLTQSWLNESSLHGLIGLLHLKLEFIHVFNGSLHLNSSLLHDPNNF